MKSLANDASNNYKMCDFLDFGMMKLIIQGCSVKITFLFETQSRITAKSLFAFTRYPLIICYNCHS